jgi:ankyrin repeat protein
MSFYQDEVNKFLRAVRRGRLDEVKDLVARGMDVTVKDNNAVQSAATLGHLEILKFLVAHGADIYSADHFCFYAAAGGHLEILKYLCAVGEEADAPLPFLLGVADLKGHRAVYDFLLEKIDWLKRDKDGKTALDEILSWDVNEALKEKVKVFYQEKEAQMLAHEKAEAEARVQSLKAVTKPFQLKR